MALAPLIAVLVSVAIDPCAAVGPPVRGQRAEAAVYLGIADDEAARGDQQTAIIAYREALRRDPGNPRARARLAGWCREGSGGDAAAPGELFSRAVALMTDGQHRQAAALLARIRLAEGDPAATLLEGICLYELGDDGPAQERLRQALADPALEDSARFFLGSIALRNNDTRQAIDLLARAAERSDSPTLRQAAAELAGAARRAGRLVVTLTSELGFDSNVALTPDGSTIVPASRDVAALQAASLLLRPLGRSGPFARVLGAYRKQAWQPAYDQGNVSGAVGLQLAAGARVATVLYGYDLVTLGDARYLSAHQLAADGRLPLGPVLVGAGYGVRFESFRQAAIAGYSGVRQSGQLDAEVRPRDNLAAGCGFLLVRDGTQDATLTHWQEGPSCRLWWVPGNDLRMVAQAAAAWRQYPTRDAMAVAERRDRIVDAAAFAEWDASVRWTIRLTLAVRKAASSVPDYAYTRFAAALAGTYTWGLW